MKSKLTTKIEKILDPEHRLPFEREASYNVAKRLREAVLLLAEEIEKLKSREPLKTRCQHNFPSHLCPECGDGTYPHPIDVNPYDSKARKRTRPKKRKHKALNPYKEKQP